MGKLGAYLIFTARIIYLHKNNSLLLLNSWCHNYYKIVYSKFIEQYHWIYFTDFHRWVTSQTVSILVNDSSQGLFPCIFVGSLYQNIQVEFIGYIIVVSGRGLLIEFILYSSMYKHFINFWYLSNKFGFNAIFSFFLWVSDIISEYSFCKQNKNNYDK